MCTHIFYCIFCGQSVLTGEVSSKWLERFLGDSKFKAPVYFEDGEHLRALWSFLSNIMDTTPTDYTVGDRIEFVLNVLCPEVSRLSVL